MEVKKEIARVEGEKCRMREEWKEERRRLEGAVESVKKEGVRRERCMSQQSQLSKGEHSVVSNKAYVPT